MGWWSRANNPEWVKTYVTSVVDKPFPRNVHELKDGKKPNRKWPGSASLTSQVTSAWNKTYLKMKPGELLCAFCQPISQTWSIWSQNFAVLVEVHQWDLQQLRKLKVSIYIMADTIWTVDDQNLKTLVIVRWKHSHKKKSIRMLRMQKNNSTDDFSPSTWEWLSLSVESHKGWMFLCSRFGFGKQVPVLSTENVSVRNLNCWVNHLAILGRPLGKSQHLWMIIISKSSYNENPRKFLHTWNQWCQTLI